MSSLSARTYRFGTRLPDPVRARMEPVIRAVSRRPLKLSGGLGVGLKLDTAGLPVTHAQAYALVRGTLETQVQEAFRRHVGPGSVVFDVGANLGFFSLIAAQLGARVEAFEPLPQSAATLRRNVAHNDFGDRITVHQAAAGDASGRAEFLHVDEGSWSHLADRGRHARTQDVIEVDVVALDDLGVEPDLVKIDVEGSELAVLAGATRILREQRPILVVETHGTNAELADLLDAVGYRAQNLDGPEPVRGAGPIHVIGTPV